MATHCSHNSNPVGNQGSTTTSKSKLLIGQRGQFWQKCHFSPCPLHRYSIGRTLTVPIFRLVSLTAFLKRFNPERIDRWGGLLLRAAKVLVATRKGRIGPRSNIPERLECARLRHDRNLPKAQRFSRCKVAWHFHTQCPDWPENDFIQTLYLKRDELERICPECCKVNAKMFPIKSGSEKN